MQASTLNSLIRSGSGGLNTRSTGPVSEKSQMSPQLVPSQKRAASHRNFVALALLANSGAMSLT
jgi:hypothetical protein